HILYVWAPSIFQHANYIMGVLALIQVVWTISFLTIKGQEFDSVVATALKQVLIIGFFYTLLLNAGQWLPAIINSLSKIGAEGGAISNLDPSSVMSQGLFVGSAVLDAGAKIGFISHPFGAFMAVVTSCIIVFSYVLIAADLLVTLITAYCLIAVSTLFFAFGVSSLTSPMARQLIQKCLAVGLKLMGLYVVVGIGTSLAVTWHSFLISSGSTDDYYVSWLSVAGACLIFWLIAKNIPQTLSSLAGVGALTTHGSEVIGAAVAAAAVGTMAAKKGYHGAVGGSKGIGGATQSVLGAAQSISGVASGNPASITRGLANMANGARKAMSGSAQAVSGKDIKTL
ncbi:MAG: P-type conjugative transfer protein TrbL, partial [Lentisphaerota bacterium]